MNNYIKAEEFLKKSDKVQNELLEWWKPQIGDLYYYNLESLNCILGTNMAEYINTDKENYSEYIPLLQMHQLIQFIEDKKYKIVIVSNDNSYDIYLWDYNSKVLLYQFLECGNDLLQALWKVAIILIEG